jgi:prophage tail gpP-like protein
MSIGIPEPLTAKIKPGKLVNLAKNKMLNMILGDDSKPKIQIIVENQELKWFKGLSLVYEVDTPVVACSFTTVFNPLDKDSRDLFQPYKIRKLKVKYSGVDIFDGFIDIITPGSDESGININIQGRSALSIAVDSDEIEKFYYTRLTLQQFCDTVIGKGLIVVTPDTPSFPTIKIDRGEKKWEAVARLAASRNYWAFPGIDSRCYLTRISQNDPTVADLKDGQSPVISVNASFDLSKRFRFYYVEGAGNGSTNGKRYTNLDIEQRTKYIKAKKENATLFQQGQREKCQDASDALSLQVFLSSWTFNNQLFQPGSFITLEAPKSMVYTPSALGIKKVELSFDEDGEKCTLDLTLPDAFESLSDRFKRPWSQVDDSEIDESLLGITQRFLGLK